jgi:hypothetical protein
MEKKTMEKDTEITRVVFKMTPKYPRLVFGQPEVIAFLLDVPANYGSIMSYMHVGQHGEADNGFARECKRATPEQYKDLKAELESLGYNLKVCKRLSFAR